MKKEIGALVLYASWTGNTRILAESIGEGLKEAGTKTVVKSIKKVRSDEIQSADIVVVGSPTHAGGLLLGVEKVKGFFDRLPKDAFEGKLCGAFSVHALAFGERVIDEIVKYFESKGGKNVQHGPVIAAGSMFLPIPRPSKKDLEKGIAFGKYLADLF